MLIACDENNQLVSLMSESEELIEKIRGSKLYCVSCGEQVRLKNGQRKIAHFAHISKKKLVTLSQKERQKSIFF
ncbi:competence protein CoiA family protein [Enterococcus rivorum]|uniref:competence protein CoiA family protein n=1 Tax=Enterococcus rivorum TaxID=762845 RepID=UPI003633B1AA